MLRKVARFLSTSATPVNVIVRVMPAIGFLTSRETFPENTRFSLMAPWQTKQLLHRIAKSQQSPTIENSNWTKNKVPTLPTELLNPKVPHTRRCPSSSEAIRSDYLSSHGMPSPQGCPAIGNHVGVCCETINTSWIVSLSIPRVRYGTGFRIDRREGCFGSSIFF